MEPRSFALIWLDFCIKIVVFIVLLKKGKFMKNFLFALLVSCFLFGVTGTANATLMGDNVNGAILQGVGSSIVQFSPASTTVDGNTEFSGQWLYSGFDQVWDISLDIHGTTFDVTVAEITSSSNNIYSGLDLFGIQLTDLDWNGTTGGILGVNESAGNSLGIKSIENTDDSITILWSSFPFGAGNTDPSGGTWSFEISGDAPAPVPEPATLFLFGIGLLGLAGVSRKK